MLKLAEKYINDFNNPITKKPELFGPKLFLLSLNEQQEALLNECLQKIETILKHDRVHRRSARSLAEWLNEDNRAKLIRITRASAGFGIQNKIGKFLTAEETLFLLEKNRLELVCNHIPISIHQLYKNITDLRKYLTFKQLTLQGYKLKCVDKLKINQQKTEDADTIEEPPTKLAKYETQINRVEKIFTSLRETGPRSFRHDIKCKSQNVDFIVTGSNFVDKESSFGLSIIHEEEFSSDKLRDYVNVCSLPCDNSVTFYNFCNVSLCNL